MKILITGATGFIGSRLLDAFYKSHEVGIIVRPNSLVSEKVSSQASGQFTYDGSLNSMLDAFDSFRPEVVIHLASYYVYDHQQHEVDVLMDSNLKVGMHLLEAMKQKEVKYLINTGTSFEHFGTNEESVVNLYAATKKAFGELCKYYSEAGLIRTVSLKLFDSYGEDDERKKLLNLLKDILKNKNELLLSPGDQIIDIVHVSDLISAYKLVVESIADYKEDYLEFGLSGKQRCSLKELVKKIEELTGESLNIKWGARAYRDREVMTPWKSYQKLPGWEPKVSLEEGLKKFFNS